MSFDPGQMAADAYNDGVKETLQKVREAIEECAYVSKQAKEALFLRLGLKGE
jgi:hypothetical protein